MKFILIAALAVLNLFQDKVLTSKSGAVSFYSEAPLEKIEARNKKLLVNYHPITGEIEATVLMKGFEFRKALMQEHFNESYLETDKYPKASFKGHIDKKNISIAENGSFAVSASGSLTIHGVTNTVTIPGTIAVANGEVSLNASFDILLSDYKIKIPAVVRNNIGKSVRISIVARQFK